VLEWGYEIDAADCVNQQPVDALKPTVSRKARQFGESSMKATTVLLLTLAGLSMPVQAEGRHREGG
jgi:hypothetical protein